MSIAEPPEASPLDAETRAEAVAAVDAAKARGWTQGDLKAWFESKGVALSDYLDAKAGKPVRPDARGTLAMISITGLPETPAGQPGAPADDPFPDIPAEMKAASRWLLWRAEPNEDPTKKPRKVPYYVTGKRRGGTREARIPLDSAEDVAQLATYAEACAALAFYPGYAGLGFALGPDGTGAHWQGIDLDNLDQHPGLTFLVQEGLPGYTEKSPSGGGIHAVGYGRPFTSLGSNSTGIEAYAAGRYFTVTGESVSHGEIVCLADFVEGRLSPLHSHRPQDTSAAAHASGGSLAGAMAAHDLRSALASMRADDRDLWIRMGMALKGLGDQGRGLWLEWSQTSSKYDPADASRTWDSFQPERTGYQAVFAEAQRGGWVNPAAGGRPNSHNNQTVDPQTEANSGHPDDTFEVLSIADIRALPDAQWLVKDAIPAGGLMFVYGPPASFKSFVCYDLALSYAYGAADWFGYERKAEGAVLYLASEGVTGAKNRIDAWQREHGVAEDTDRFHLIRKTINFMSDDDRGRLVRTVKRHIEACGPVSLIFVDTVSRVLPGADENLQKDMTVFVGACDALREFGATVVGVHHTNKEGSMRGSTVFLGQGDAVYRVDREEGAKRGMLTCEKLKDAEDGWKRAFEVREQSWMPAGKIESVSSLVAVATAETPQEPDTGNKWPSKDVCRSILRDIDAAWNKGHPWSPHSRAANEGKYAVYNISQAYGLKAGLAQMMVQEWQRNAILVFEIADKKTKVKGLRVAEWPF